MTTEEHQKDDAKNARHKRHGRCNRSSLPVPGMYMTLRPAGIIIVIINFRQQCERTFNKTDVIVRKVF